MAEASPANFTSSDENLLGPLATPETSQMSPSPVKMTSGSDLLTKCLEFSQALEQKGQVFNLKVSVGTFSLDTRGATPKVLERKKKLSPSQARRNQKRRENFLKKKAASPEDTPSPASEKKQEEGETHECDVCDKVFKSEKGLKTHKAITHKKEVLRSPTPNIPTRKMTPEKESQREEECVCCRKVMSYNHQCEEEEEEEEDEHEEEEDPTPDCLEKFPAGIASGSCWRCGKPYASHRVATRIIF